MYFASLIMMCDVTALDTASKPLLFFKRDSFEAYLGADTGHRKTVGFIIWYPTSGEGLPDTVLRALFTILHSDLRFTETVVEIRSI